MKRSVSLWSLSSAGAGLVAAAALCLAPRVSLAQDAPAEAAPSQPAAPPGNYPPPPPRAANAQPQQPYYQGGQPGYYPPPPQYYYPPPRVNRRSQWGYYPEAEPAGVYRPFSFTLAIGPGWLNGPMKGPNYDQYDTKAGLSYNLIRLGFGIVPNLQFTLAFEATGVTSVSPLTNEDSWLHQENWLAGLQFFFLRRFYLRGAVGVGEISETSDSAAVSNGAGVVVAGGAGFEFVQTRHVSLALELNGSRTQYAREHWATGGADVAVSFF